MKNLRTTFLAGAVLGAALSTPLLAQDFPRLTLIRDDVTRSAVLSLLSGASARGVPTEPLMSKALEGVAKKASSKAITDAVRALEGRMRRALDLLGHDASGEEIAAGADALSVGVADKTLRQMRAAAPRRSIVLEIGVLTELVARKVPRDKAAKMVLDLMARGATPLQLTALSAEVQGDVAAGLKPEVALDLRGRGVLSLLPPSPSAATLQARPR